MTSGAGDQGLPHGGGPRGGRVAAPGRGPVVSRPGPGGVLISGVYGAGKSSVAAEIAHLLEQRCWPYALLDLDYLAWGGANFDHDADYFGLMLRNLTAVAANYREVGVNLFVVAWFVRDHGALRAVREAVGVPLRVIRLTVPWGDIRQRLAADATTGREEDLRESAAQIAASEGVGVEDHVVANDRPIEVVAGEIMSWLGWQ